MIILMMRDYRTSKLIPNKHQPGSFDMHLQSHRRVESGGREVSSGSSLGTKDAKAAAALKAAKNTQVKPVRKP